MMKPGARTTCLLLFTLTACSASIVPAKSPSSSPTASSSPSASPSVSAPPNPGPTEELLACQPNAGEAVHGRVVDASGKPVADAEISLKVTEADYLRMCPATVRLNTRSGSDGSYTFGRDAIGGVRTDLTVAKAGYVSQTIVIAPVMSRAGDNINHFDFTLVTTPAP